MDAQDQIVGNLLRCGSDTTGTSEASHGTPITCNDAGDLAGIRALAMSGILAVPNVASGSVSVDITNAQLLTASEIALNWDDRRLFAADGTDVILSWSTAGLADFNDSNIQTSGWFKGASLLLAEITTPAALADYGQIYTKANNELFFQDGAGVEHLLHGDAFSDMWFHDPASGEVAISAQDAFTKITSFENIGSEDNLGNITSNTTNKEMTVGTGGAGTYTIAYHTSITATGASKEMVICPGIELATPIDVTGATNATPIVVTSVAHGLKNGDMVQIAGCTTNTGANGSFVVSAKADDSFTLLDLNGDDSVGNGVYDASSGDITIKYPGTLVIHREVSHTDLGVGGGHADHDLAVGDKLAMYVANLDDANNLNIYAISMDTRRIGD